MRLAPSREALPGPGIAAAMLLTVALVACGGGGGDTATGTPPGGSPTSAQVAVARRALCHDLVQFGGGAFRVPNLQRILPKLKIDAHLLIRAGDDRLAS